MNINFLNSINYNMFCNFKLAQGFDQLMSLAASQSARRYTMPLPKNSRNYFISAIMKQFNLIIGVIFQVFFFMWTPHIFGKSLFRPSKISISISLHINNINNIDSNDLLLRFVSNFCFQFRFVESFQFPIDLSTKERRCFKLAITGIRTHDLPHP